MRKREDGYHDLQTVFLPLPLCDELEIVPSGTFAFSQSGIPIDGDAGDNLVVKAWRMMQQESGGRVGNVSIHLTKHIPFGAGLGGGSSDAAFAIKMIDELFDLHFPAAKLREIAAKLGADCPFFIDNRPAYATGKGEILQPLDGISANGYSMLLVKPDEAVSTAEAYRGVTPRLNRNDRISIHLPDALKRPVETWRETVVNDFEESVFRSHPRIGALKEQLYSLGALYAAMSGSGASVYGIFNQDTSAIAAQLDPSLWIWSGKI